MQDTTASGYLEKIGDSILHPKLWMIISSLSLFIHQYVFNQWNFAISFMMLLILDTVCGVYVANRTGVYSGKLFRVMLADKCLAYFTIIIAFSIGAKATLQDSDINLIQYLNIPFYSLFIAVEFRSIVVKWYRFKKWPWLGDILKMIDRTKKDKIDEIHD